MKKLIVLILVLLALDIMAILIFLPFLPFGLRDCRDYAFKTQEHFARLGIQSDVVSVDLQGEFRILGHAVTIVHIGGWDILYDYGIPQLSHDVIKFRWGRVVPKRGDK